jgi:hypothetical protein
LIPAENCLTKHHIDLHLFSETINLVLEVENNHEYILRVTEVDFPAFEVETAMAKSGIREEFMSDIVDNFAGIVDNRIESEAI